MTSEGSVNSSGERINPIHVVVKNFQAVEHADVVIDGFTVIKGESEIGKSALMRAIGAALNNKSGTSYIRHGESECYVMIHFLVDDFKIEWHRTKKESWYIFDGDDENPYRKLKGSVPQPIIDFGIQEIVTEISKKKFNPQLCYNQHDTSFFIFDKDSDKAELLSEISNTTQVVKARRLLGKELKSKKTLINDKLKRLERFERGQELLDEINVEKVKSDTQELVEDLVGKMDLHIKTNENLKKLRHFRKKSALLDVTPELVELQACEKSASSLREKHSKLQGFRESQGLLKILAGIQRVEVEQVSFESFKVKLSKFKRYKKAKVASSVEISTLLPVEEPKGLATLKDRAKKLDAFRTICRRLEALRKLDAAAVSEPEVVERSLKAFGSKLEKYLEFQNKKLEISKIDFDISEVQRKIDEVHEELSSYESCPLCARPFEKNHKHD